MAVPKQKKGRGATHTRRSANSKLAAPAQSFSELARLADFLPQLWLLQGPRGHRHRVEVTMCSAREAGPSGPASFFAA